jgi:hypothetical protein
MKWRKRKGNTEVLSLLLHRYATIAIDVLICVYIFFYRTTIDPEERAKNILSGFQVYPLK